MAWRTAVLVLLLMSRSPVSGQDRGFQPEDYFNIVSVSQVAVAPTGDFVAFTVTTVEEEENTRHQEIWLQPLRNGRPDGEAFRITDPTAESSAPSWSPNGALLSFSSKRGEDLNAVWFLRVEGPGGEASHIDGVEGTPIWSPAGDWIAYTKASDSGDDDEDSVAREGWIAPDAITSTLDPERFDGRVVTSIRYKRDGILTLRPHYSVSGKSQLFVVPAEGGVARRLTDLPFDVGSVVWSQDGRQIFFSGDEYQDDELNDENTGDLWTVPTSGGPARRLTTNPGSESNPAVSPDGRRMAFLSNPSRGGETDLLVVEIGSDGSLRGEPLNLTEGWDLRPRDPAWTHGGDFLRFSAGIGGNAHLFGVPATGGRVAQITTGDRQLSAFSFSDDDGVMAFTSTDAVTPTELYVATGDGSTEQKPYSMVPRWRGGW